MPSRVTLVLADRPTGRAALVALAGAVEASPLSGCVDLCLARGPAAVVAAARKGVGSGSAVAVAWSFFSSDAAAAARDLALVRGSMPERVVHVAGGVHASAEPEATLALGFDLVARGEGEATLVGVLRELLQGGDPRRVPGLSWSAARGLATSGRARPVNLDAHPGYSRRLGKALALEVTRGCAWSCRFCQTPFVHRAPPRHRSVEAAREFARFACELGHRDLRFLTPSALSYGAAAGEVRLEAIEALLAGVRAEVGPSRRIFFGTFPSELRPEHVSPDSLALIRRWADNRDVLIGAQSGSDRLLEVMRRGHSVDDVVRAVECCRGAGMTAAVDFIVGLPGEDEDDLEATRRLMVRLTEAGARVHAHVFLPLPGTPWRGQAAGRLDATTRQLLDGLASRGRAYGQWRRQVELGAQLARLRRRRGAS
jgi:B12-binding domain/radical SAM domain protein